MKSPAQLSKRTLRNLLPCPSKRSEGHLDGKFVQLGFFYFILKIALVCVLWIILVYVADPPTVGFQKDPQLVIKDKNKICQNFLSFRLSLT